MGIRAQLQGIYDDKGLLTPELVVEEARSAESELHSQFEWDDEVAAESFRLAQAANLIRSIKITYATDEDGRAKRVRGWVSVVSADGKSRSYQPTEKAMENDFTRQLVLQECKREWKSFEAKYGHLQEFWQIVRGDGGEAAA